MKKVLTALGLVCTVCVFAVAKPNDDREFILKIGFQPQSIVSAFNKDINTNLGVSGGVEYFQYFGNIFAFGAGATYDLPRKFRDDNYKGYVSFMPLFLGAKIRGPLSGINNNYAFLSLRLGYSVPMSKDTFSSINGGFYDGFGLGVSLNVLVIEAVYSVNRFTYYKADTDEDGSCSTITLYAGFKFE